MFEQLRRKAAPRPSDAAAPAARRRAPSADLAAQLRAAAQRILARIRPNGAVDPADAAAPHDRRARLKPRVHQVLATLGYGDAIGHEVLGIQRVLRAAGYESEIFVETADPRLEDLTIDYRDMVDDVSPDDILIHHFSIGSRASRTPTRCPSGWSSSITTSRRRSTSSASTRTWSSSASADGAS